MGGGVPVFYRQGNGIVVGDRGKQGETGGGLVGKGVWPFCN